MDTEFLIITFAVIALTVVLIGVITYYKEKPYDGSTQQKQTPKAKEPKPAAAQAPTQEPMSEDDLRDQIKKEVLAELNAKKKKRSLRTTWASVLLFLQIASFAGRMIQQGFNLDVEIDSFSAIFVSAILYIPNIVAAILILTKRTTEARAPLFSKESLAILLICIQIAFNVALTTGTYLGMLISWRDVGYYFFVPMMSAIVAELISIVAVILLIIEEKKR